MIARGVAALAALCAGLSCVTPSFADTKAPPEVRRAKALFEQGVALSDEGKWTDSLAAFQQSDALVASPTVRYNIAMTLRALGRYVEARSELQRILGSRPLKPALKKDAEALLAEVRAKIVTVSLTVSPADADIQMDGSPITPSPGGQLDVDPGKHVFVVSARNHDTTTVTQALATSGEALVLTAPLTAVREVRPTPFYARPWFLATAGVVVASGATVAIIFAARPRDAPPAAPPPATVDRILPAAFRF